MAEHSGILLIVLFSGPLSSFSLRKGEMYLKHVMQRNQKRESITITREKTPIGETLTSKVTFPDFTCT
jgi:hypothetical protein